MLSSQQLNQIKEYFKDKPILKVWLFGSYARKDYEAESDIDLLIKPDYSKRLGWKFFAMKSELQLLLGKPVDIVSEAYLKDFAKPSVDGDKLLIYEQSA